MTDAERLETWAGEYRKLGEKGLVVGSDEWAEPGYSRGWCEGVSAVLRELMGRDSGGFLSGPKDKHGKPEEWLAVGFVFEVITDLQGKPEPARAPACQPAARALLASTVPAGGEAEG